MKAKITDVAQRAGVSIATVSHVINGTRYVTDVTRGKVEEAIRELGYSPNMSARSFKTGRRNLIGYVAPDIGNRFFALILEEIEDTLSLRGYNLVVVNTREDYDREIAGLKLLTSGIADGIIIASTFQEYKDIAPYLPAGFPAVQIDRLPRGYTGDSVRVSTFEAVREAIADLIGEGCTRVGYIASISRLSSTAEREQGYRQALEEAGIALDPGLMKQGDARSRSGYDCMRQLVEEGADAVFISNSVMASGAMSYLDNCGLRIGRDIQVVSMRDYEWHRFQKESVRTIEQPAKEMARLAAQQVMDRIDNPQLPGRETILRAAYHKADDAQGEPHLF